LTDDLVNVFVRHTMLESMPRLGSRVCATITFESPKGLSGSMIKNKELKIEDDRDIILGYLRRKGSMPLTATSSPEEIKRVFNMSKKAFKRALGALYKDRSISFTDDQTVLNKD